jgi:hypothetical protein
VRCPTEEGEIVILSVGELEPASRPQLRSRAQAASVYPSLALAVLIWQVSKDCLS